MHDDDNNDHLEDEKHLTNPAGRLLLFFRHTRQHGAHSSPSNPVSTTSLVASYLDIAEVNVAEFYSAAAGLMQLPGEARRQIGALVRPAVPRATLLAPYGVVETTLPGIFNARTRVHDFNEPIDSGVLVALDMGSAMLFHHSGKRVLDDITLTQIRERATAILVSLANSTIPDDVREVLRVHAQRLLDAVNVYRVNGSDAVLREADGLAGAVVRNVPRIPDQGQNPLVRSIVGLARFVAAATTILGVPAAIAGGVDFMEDLIARPAISTEAPAPQFHDGEIVIEYTDEFHDGEIR